MIKQWLGLIPFMLLSGIVQAQQIKLLSADKPVSLRGLSVVNDQVVWVSGSGGSVGVSTNGGKNWSWIRVPRYEKSDFRDIEAFSDQEAVIMGITEPGVILRTMDGGKSWTTVFEDSAKSVFLDAMDFSGDPGVLVGDPVEGKIFLAESADRGKSWKKITGSGFESTAIGEAFFAASGSNIRYLQDGHYALVSGGKKSCLYISSGRYPLLLNQGEETTGANSIAINPANPNEAFIVGGNFKYDKLQIGNSLRIQFHPFSQEPPLTPPHGYRSCVEYLNDKQMICCGTSGVDISADGGLHWKKISDKSFHVCRRAKEGQSLFLAGADGRIALLEWNSSNLYSLRTQ
jgi:hypothetical protein